MMSNMGKRRHLAEAIRHLWFLGGLHAYYRGLTVSWIDVRSLTPTVAQTYLGGAYRRVPVSFYRTSHRTSYSPEQLLCNWHEHFRSIEACLCKVYRQGEAWCVDLTGVRQYFWKCWSHQCISPQSCSDSSASFWFSWAPATVYRRVGRRGQDLGTRWLERLLSWFISNIG